MSIFTKAPKRRGEKWSARRIAKTNQFGRSALNSELNSKKQYSSNTQVHKTSDYHRNCKLETILKVQKAGGVNMHDNPRARQSSETERKMVNAFPDSHHITALQLKIELRFLNFQPKTSNIQQYFLLEEQRQLQTKLSRICQVWWCKLVIFCLPFFFFLLGVDGVLDSLDYLDKRLGGQERLSQTGQLLAGSQRRL